MSDSASGRVDKIHMLGGLIKSTCWDTEDFTKRIHGNVLGRKLSLCPVSPGGYAPEPQVIHTGFHPGDEGWPNARFS